MTLQILKEPSEFMERQHIEKDHMLAALPALARKEVAFYKPIVIEDAAWLNNSYIPAIVYPCLGIEEKKSESDYGYIEKDDPRSIYRHVTNVLAANRDRLRYVEATHETAFVLVFLYKKGESIMTDVWTFADQKDGVQTQGEIVTFNGLNYEGSQTAGSFAIAGILIAAMETSRLLRHGSISEFIRANRPETPLVDGDFYPKFSN